MVSALIDLLTKWWNVSLVKTSFLPFEVDSILRIPLSYSMPKDKLIWLGNKRGEFTVKRAYHIAFNLLETKKGRECSSGDPYKSPWMLFASGESAIIGAAQFVKRILNVLIMPFSAVTYPFLYGINGRKTPWACKRFNGLLLTQPCSSSPTTLNKFWNFSLELLRPYGIIGIR